MRTRTGIAILALITAACGGGAGTAGGTTAPTSGPVAGGTEIVIEGFAFGPDVVTVPVGATVTWVNRENGVPHTTTSDDGVWKSGTLSPGEGFSFTFDRPGTYTYFCSIHPNMKGTIVVQG